MAGSGPPPNPASRRQSGNQAHTWTDLPADGFDGPIPSWPLLGLDGMGDAADAFHDRELDVWSAVWRSPQAAAWALNGWTHDVALYVRFLVIGETGDLKAATEARMWSDRLGLNPAAMLKNRWRVRGDEVAAARVEPAKAARKRLKVVADVAGA